MLNWFKQPGFAIVFLTRIPLPFPVEYKEDLPARSMTYYPPVGALIGVLVVAVDLLLTPVFPARVVNVLVLAGLIWLSGGLHLDGFMDTMDGIFSGRERKRILTIMHDSNTGAFGVLGVVMLLLLKYNILLSLSGNLRMPALIFVPALSRWLIVYTAWKYPLAESSKLGKIYRENLGVRQVLFSGIWLILLAIIIYLIWDFSFILQLAVLIFSWLAVVLFVRLVLVKIGGVTGDIYGAVNEIAEVTGLLLIVAEMGL